MTLCGELSHTVELGSDIHGNIQRMENVLESLPSRLSACEKALATLKEQMENAKAEVEKPFEQEQELSEKAARLAELNALLNMDKRENAALDAEPEHTEIEPVKAFCKKDENTTFMNYRSHCQYRVIRCSFYRLKLSCKLRIR